MSETNVKEEEMLLYIKRYLDKEIGNLWQVFQGVFLFFFFMKCFLIINMTKNLAQYDEM